jgi:hypothetical protein
LLNSFKSLSLLKVYFFIIQELFLFSVSEIFGLRIGQRYSSFHMVAKRGVLDNSLYRRQAVYTQISLFYAFSYILMPL